MCEYGGATFISQKTQLFSKVLFRNYDLKWPLQRHYNHITVLFSCFPATESDKRTVSISNGWTQHIANRISTVIDNSCNPLAYICWNCCSQRSAIVVKHNISMESSWHSPRICCKSLHFHRFNSRFFIRPHTKVWVTKASRATLLWSLLHLEPFFSRRTRHQFKCIGIVLRDVSCILIRFMMQKMFSFESCPIGETNTTECKKWRDGCLCGTQFLKL